MRRMVLCSALVALSIVGCNESGNVPVSGTTTSPPNNSAVQPDNTAKNERDRSDAAKTPIDQNENQADVDTTANIRKQVVDTKMSIDAQNVKIITQNGKVTLRGPVHSEEEKKTIEDMAVKVAGAGNVDNQMEVKL